MPLIAGARHPNQGFSEVNFSYFPRSVSSILPSVHSSKLSIDRAICLTFFTINQACVHTPRTQKPADFVLPNIHAHNRLYRGRPCVLVTPHSPVSLALDNANDGDEEDDGDEERLTMVTMTMR
jgi:hypothetical protein